MCQRAIVLVACPGHHLIIRWASVSESYSACCLSQPPLHLPPAPICVSEREDRKERMEGITVSERRLEGEKGRDGGKKESLIILFTYS